MPLNNQRILLFAKNNKTLRVFNVIRSGLCVIYTDQYTPHTHRQGALYLSLSL